ncbi:DUF6923 family protein [Streptomyces sp. NPDC051684]|uniref:DUF7927 domain-containing protein n=1 Tax=Streptomyces sp. NPDC051684 TaxID=3365670 RepID=UPI0037BB5FB5
MGGARTWFRRWRVPSRVPAVGVVLGAVLAMVAGPLPVAEASAAPGEPADPTVLFHEDFENTTAGADPVRLTDYTGAAPGSQTYTAAPEWLKSCNGWVMNYAHSEGFQPGVKECGSEGFWNGTRRLVYGLGVQNGSADPAENDAVGAYTQTPSPGAGKTELETGKPIEVKPAKRFVTAKLNLAATGCGNSSADMKFFVKDGDREVSVSKRGFEVCENKDYKIHQIPGGGRALVNELYADSPALVEGGSLGLRMVNDNGNSAGNDHAFDDVRLVDVSPHVDKSFADKNVEAGKSTKLTFTVTNTSDLLAKEGWSFDDDLPAGMTVASPANTSTTCTNGAVTATAGGTSVGLKGDLKAKQTSCTLTVDVTAAKSGKYSNCPENIADVNGVKVPEQCADVTFTPGPEYKITKTSVPAGDTQPGPGDKVAYKVTVENTGRVPVTTPVSDDLTGVLDDATYNDDAKASAGPAPTYAKPKLTWKGVELAAGEKATLTYSVTLKDPATGDGTVKNAVTGSSVSNCATGAEKGCTTTVEVDKPPRGGYCTDVAYLSQYLGGKTGLYSVDLTTGEQAKVADTSPGASIGYSVHDGAVYGVGPDGKLGRYNPRTDKITTTDVKGWSGSNPRVNSAANSTDGSLLYVRDYGSGNLYSIDIDPDSPTYSSIVKTVKTDDLNGSSAYYGNVPDWAVNPADGFLYGILADNGTLWRLDPATGKATNLGVHKTPVAAYGGTWFDNLGTFYAANNDTGAIYAIDLSASSATAPIGKGDVPDAYRAAKSNATSGNDAAGCLKDYDFGDAPDSYGTTKGKGPIAAIDKSLMLGKNVSSERQARTPGDDQALDARGDTFDDGVATWPKITTATRSYQVPVALANSTDGPATLSGWVDFDGDGTFDTGELATVAVPAGATSARLNWSGISGAKAGATYARLWLQAGTVDEPSSRGTADATRTVAGEIEDYPVTVEQAPEPLDIAKSADKKDAKPGDKVTYTVTVTNPGKTTHKDVTVSDDLKDVVDDATYNGDAKASAGEVSYEKPKLTWTGDVPAGSKVTITYTVTAKASDDGNKDLGNTVTGPPDSNCPEGSTDPKCASDVPLAALEIVKTPGRASDVRPGGTVDYTVRIRNVGTADYEGASVGDDLTGVLDDATYNGDAKASAGKVSYEKPKLTWTGDLKAGATATVTYSVTVNDPVDGDHDLRNTVVGPPGSNCAKDSTDPKCTSDVPIAALKIAKSVDTKDAKPGDKVTYTVTVKNTGKADYEGASVSDDLKDVVDDATYNGDAKASAGQVVYEKPKLTWTGDLKAGARATVTYSVTVNSPPEGDQNLKNVVTGPPGSHCADDCGTETPVAALEFEKTSDAKKPVHPGDKVTYTVTVTNTGKTAYNGATFTDDLTKVIDDASYNGDAKATSGDVAYEKPELTWKGNVPAGKKVTVTYSVDVFRTPKSTGDGTLDNGITGPPGSNCAKGSDDPKCDTSTGDIPTLTIKKTGTTTAPKPGGTVDYRVTVTNNSATSAYEGAAFTDDLSGLIDDATYNKDATATSGTVSYEKPKLTWKGDVPAGRTVTLTYSVTVGTPPAGDKKLTNTVVSQVPGTNCQEGSDDPDCTTDVGIPTLKFKKTAAPKSPKAGDTLTYKVTVTNDGAAAYKDATFTDDLTKVLDDATYNQDAKADIGSVSYAEPKLTWTGDLAKSATATVTYTFSVTDAGDGKFVNGVVGPPGSNCPEGGTDPHCTTVLPAPDYDFGDAPDTYKTRRVSGGAFHEIVDGLRIGREVDAERDGVPHAKAGHSKDDDGIPQTVTLYQHQERFTAKVPVTNTTGRDAMLAGWIDINEDGSFERDEMVRADVPNDATEATLTWDGLQTMKPADTFARLRLFGDEDVAAAKRAGTRAVVRDAEPTGFGGPGEVEDHGVRVEPTHLEIAKSASADEPKPGDRVTYTVTVAGSGPEEYVGATFTDDLSEVLDDAAYNDDAAASVGDVTYDKPKLTWHGDLAAGERATVTYSVTVDKPVKGDRTLTNAVTGPPGSTCETACTTTAKVPPAPGGPEPTPTPTPGNPENPSNPPMTPPAKPGDPDGHDGHLSDTGSSDTALYLGIASALALGLGLLVTMAVRRRRGN